jgi:hypothetical protein
MDPKLAIKAALKYSSYAAAFRTAYSGIGQPGVIVLGDNCQYWVVNIREASVLIKAGYELAS